MVMTIEEKGQALNNKLKDYDTESILGMISLNYSTFANADGMIDSNLYGFKSDLMSPQKQRLYLAGLLMSTEYSGKPPVHNENLQWYKALEDDIQNITSDYIKGFLAFDSEAFDPTSETSREDLKKRQVAMEAFVSFFDTGTLRYEEQTVALIHTLYAPFDQELIKHTGLCVSDYNRFYEFTKAKISSQLDNANAVKD